MREQVQVTYNEPTDRSLLSPSFIPLPRSPSPASPQPMSPNEPPSGFEGRVSSPNRPTSDGVAFPFKLGRHLGDKRVNASTVTLESQAGIEGTKANAEVVNEVSTEQMQNKNERAERDVEIGEVQRESNRYVGQGESKTETATPERPGVERFVTASEG